MQSHPKVDICGGFRYLEHLLPGHYQEKEVKALRCRPGAYQIQVL